MYTISKTYGIGQVTEESDTKVTVYFADADVEKSMIKRFVTLYNSEAEAEAAIEEIEEAAANERTEIEESLSGCGARTSDRSETNRINAMNNAPSSMRD